MLTVSLPAAEDLHHTTFSSTSWLNNLSSSPWELSRCLSNLHSHHAPFIFFFSPSLKNYSHSLKSEMEFLILSSINSQQTSCSPPVSPELSWLFSTQLMEKQAGVWADEVQHLCWSQQLEVHTWTHLGSSMQVKPITQFWHWQQTMFIQNKSIKYIMFYFKVEKYLLKSQNSRNTPC